MPPASSTAASEPGHIASESPVLTLPEAAALLRIHPATAKRLAAKGTLPGVLPKVGGQWRVNARVLHDFINSPVTRPGDSLGPHDDQNTLSGA